MEPEMEGKIKETVLEILKSSNMADITEYKVREKASAKLGIDLSSLDNKRFVRHVIEAFLSGQHPRADPDPDEVENAAKKAKDEEKEPEEEEEDEEAQPKKKKKRGGNKEYDNEGGLVVCRLSEKRRVTVNEFRGKTLVSVREYYRKEGKELPSAKGISLTTEQWSSLKKNIPGIEKAIRKMKSRLN
ncbi:hypothetical protein NMG60_11026929 [Bertholletia excelsa]